MRWMLTWCLLLCVGMAFPGQPAGSDTGIGYPDVGAALRDLRADPDAEELQAANGWTWFLVDEAEQRLAFWAFAPFSDPAYPAAVKRVLMMRDGALVMETRTMCHAPLAACDAFLAATEAHTGQFKERFANAVIVNNQGMRDRAKAERKYQQRLKRHAESIYRRP